MIITIPYGVSLYVLGLLTYLSLAVGLNALTLILAMLATVTLGVTGFVRGCLLHASSTLLNTKKDHVPVINPQGPYSTFSSCNLAL